MDSAVHDTMNDAVQRRCNHMPLVLFMVGITHFNYHTTVVENNSMTHQHEALPVRELVLSSDPVSATLGSLGCTGV